MRANKNPNIQEISCLSEGYFAKIYVDCVQIFTPKGDLYARLYKKTTPNTTEVARTLIRFLNKKSTHTAIPDAVALSVKDSKIMELEKELEVANAIIEEQKLNAARGHSHSLFLQTVADRTTATLENVSKSLARQ